MSADPAAFLGDVDRAESEFGGLLDRVDGEVVILVPLARVGSDVVGGEPLRHVLDRELVV